MPIESVERLEELSAGRVCLIFLAKQVVGAVLEQLLVCPLLELSLHLEVLRGDALHVGRLLDLILAYHFLDVHLEALTAAKRVSVPCKHDHVARIDRLLVVGMLRFFRDLLDWTQNLRGIGRLNNLSAVFAVLEEVRAETESVLFHLVL